MSDEAATTESKSTESTGAENTGTASAGNSAWLYADGVPGSGEKPDFFKSDKYTSVAEQARAYTELEKKFGGFSGAPEKYELTLEEDIKNSIELNAEDPLLKTFSDIAKSANMTQDTYNKIMNA